MYLNTEVGELWYMYVSLLLSLSLSLCLSVCLSVCLYEYRVSVRHSFPSLPIPHPPIRTRAVHGMA